MTVIFEQNKNVGKRINKTIRSKEVNVTKE